MDNENLINQLKLPKEDWNLFFVSKGSHVSKQTQLVKVWLNIICGYCAIQERDHHTPKMTFLFVWFKVLFMAYLYDFSQCFILVFDISIIGYNWNVIQNTKYIGKFLEDLIYFCWKMVPAGAAARCNLTYLFLPNWHAKVIKYVDLLSSLRL